MAFPLHRMRRLRGNPRSRDMVRETRLHPAMLMEPFFVAEGSGRREPVSSMPGVFQLSVDTLVEECRASRDLGIGSVLLFGIPASKDAVGSTGYAKDGIVPKALRALK